MLQNEMAVQQHRFHFGQEVVILIQIAPARLHHADGGIGEMVDGAGQKIDRRNEIGVEDRHEFAGRRLQAFLQRAGFETRAVGAVQVHDRVAHGLILLHQRFGERVRIVGRIVEHLNLQQLLRVLHLRGFVDQPLHHIALVVKRKLDGDARKFRKAQRWFTRRFPAILEIGVDDFVAMQAVEGQNTQHAEVRD